MLLLFQLSIVLWSFYSNPNIYYYNVHQFWNVFWCFLIILNILRLLGATLIVISKFKVTSLTTMWIFTLLLMSLWQTCTGGRRTWQYKSQLLCHSHTNQTRDISLPRQLESHPLQLETLLRHESDTLIFKPKHSHTLYDSVL